MRLHLNKLIPDSMKTLVLHIDEYEFPLASATINGNLAEWSTPILFSNGGKRSVSLIDPTVTHVDPTPSVVSDPTLRSWPLTEIADEGPTAWWFPIGRGVCDMHDKRRPWTWERWKPPTAERCGWLSIPDVRSGMEAPVSETAHSVYTALISSPDIGGRASVNRPRGPSVKLAVWAVYPREYDGRTVNATRRLTGPYQAPITVCLPGDEDQVIHGYDDASGRWVVLESVEAEREGHICGLHRHDLGLLVVAGG